MNAIEKERAWRSCYIRRVSQRYRSAEHARNYTSVRSKHESRVSGPRSCDGRWFTKDKDCTGCYINHESLLIREYSGQVEDCRYRDWSLNAVKSRIRRTIRTLRSRSSLRSTKQRSSRSDSRSKSSLIRVKWERDRILRARKTRRYSQERIAIRFRLHLLTRVANCRYAMDDTHFTEKPRATLKSYFGSSLRLNVKIIAFLDECATFLRHEQLIIGEA